MKTFVRLLLCVGLAIAVAEFITWYASLWVFGGLMQLVPPKNLDEGTAFLGELVIFYHIGIAVGLGIIMGTAAAISKNLIKPIIGGFLLGIAVALFWGKIFADMVLGTPGSSFPWPVFWFEMGLNVLLAPGIFMVVRAVRWGLSKLPREGFI